MSPASPTDLLSYPTASMTTSSPLFIDAEQTRRALPFDRLIAGLHAAFVAGAETPLRHRHALPQGGMLLLMPAWQGRARLGVKIATVFPANGARGLNAVSSTYLLCDPQTGAHLAIIDGNELTGRRTAAASALAGAYLAQQDAAELLIVGAGHVAGMLADAWRTVRPITRIRVWNIHPERAVDLAVRLRMQGYDATVPKDLREAAHTADIISCATLALNPLISGVWLKHGAHLDLIGGFTPAMREADDEAILRARVFIDTEAALTEAGDLTQPLARGVLTREQVVGTLADLCRGTVRGRATRDEITVFKSVGTALEDLAAAALVHENLSVPRQ